MNVRCARKTFNVTLAIYKYWECLYVHFPRSLPLENAMPQVRASCDIESFARAANMHFRNIKRVDVRHSPTHYKNRCKPLAISKPRKAEDSRPKRLAKKLKKRCSIRF